VFGLDGGSLVENPCKASLSLDLTPANLVEHMSDIYIRSWQDLTLHAPDTLYARTFVLVLRFALRGREHAVTMTAESRWRTR
jgi:hypothetical protein